MEQRSAERGPERPELLGFCEVRTAELRARLETLVRLESPSLDKAAVDRCGTALAGMLRGIGGEVRTVPQGDRGDHVRAEFPGERGRILLLGHFDTVWDVGQVHRMPLQERDGRLFGPGIYDMKAGIAVAMLAVEALTAHVRVGARPRVVMFWTTDEEIGSGTSRALIEREARASDAVLVLEPSLPGGAAKTRRKGCGEFHLRARGISAHAGIDPSKGASAIDEIARQVVALQKLNDPERGTTVNVGIIRGGTRPNVVAEEAEAVVDVRAGTREDAERLAAAMFGLRPHDPRVQLQVTGGFERPPLERGAGVARLFEVARAVASHLGRTLEEGGTGGGSDGNFTAALGVPTLDGLGPEGDGAHALHEHVLLADLTWRAAFLAALICAVPEPSHHRR